MRKHLWTVVTATMLGALCVPAIPAGEKDKKE